MTKQEKQQQIFEHWKSKNIVNHMRLTTDMKAEINRALKDYPVEEVKTYIDFYAEILEVGTSDDDKKYFWSYKWTLGEFLRRGIKKFDGQSTSNYLRKQKVAAPQAVIFKRK